MVGKRKSLQFPYSAGILDESGRNEMYRLLDRFQKTRPRDDLEDLEKKPLETKVSLPIWNRPKRNADLIHRNAIIDDIQRFSK